MHSRTVETSHWARRSHRRIIFSGLAAIMLAGLCLNACVAKAQDVVDAGVPTISAGVAMSDITGTVSEVDPIIKELLAAAKAGKIGLAIVLALVALTAAVRRIGVKLPGKVGDALRSKWASWAIPLVGSIVGFLASWLRIGGPFPLEGLFGALLIGLAGGGWLQGALKSSQVAAAEAAGDKAAAAVATKEDAVSVLGKGPQP